MSRSYSSEPGVAKVLFVFAWRWCFLGQYSRMCADVSVTWNQYLCRHVVFHQTQRLLFSVRGIRDWVFLKIHPSLHLLRLPDFGSGGNKVSRLLMYTRQEAKSRNRRQTDRGSFSPSQQQQWDERSAEWRQRQNMTLQTITSVFSHVPAHAHWLMSRVSHAALLPERKRVCLKPQTLGPILPLQPPTSLDADVWSYFLFFFAIV